jgi:hypothetical protein
MELMIIITKKLHLAIKQLDLGHTILDLDCQQATTSDGDDPQENCNFGCHLVRGEQRRSVPYTQLTA